jgi:GTPase
VPFVGTVVSGVILSGHLATGQEVWLGPDGLGHFQPTIIKSMQRKRVHVDHAHAGQSVSLNLKRIKRSGVRKGMVILSKNLDTPPKATRVFEGQVLILYHNSTVSSPSVRTLKSFVVQLYLINSFELGYVNQIQQNYQAMLHVGKSSVRQTVSKIRSNFSLITISREIDHSASTTPTQTNHLNANRYSDQT